MIRPFGEFAFLIELGSAERARALATSLRTDPVEGIVEAVPGLASLLVEFETTADPDRIAQMIDRRLSSPLPATVSGRLRSIPVVYGGEEGPDLEEVAGLCGMSAADVAARHAASELRVLFCGFAPGFAYLGDLPQELRVPRLATPRIHTPAGSVAIAESMTGIYPSDLPGGWRIIGRTPVRLFDPDRDPPAYLVPGDAVRFTSISRDEWQARAGTPEDW